MELTEREKSVLFNLAKGMKNSEISKILNISVHTTKAHLESIYDKLGVQNRVQAALLAVSIGLVDLKEVIR